MAESEAQRMRRLRREGHTKEPQDLGVRTAASSLSPDDGRRGHGRSVMIAVGCIAIGIAGFWTAQNHGMFASAKDQCELAIIAINGGDASAVHSALGPCGKVAEDNPNDPVAVLRLGMLKYEAGDRSDGIQLIRQAAGMGDAKAVRQLSYVTKDPDDLHSAVAFFREKARSGTETSSFEYAEVSMWNDDLYLKSHNQMISDGTYAKFVDAAEKGATLSISNLAFKTSDPSKPAVNANDEAVSEALYQIAAQKGFYSGTSGLASRAFTRAAMASKNGNNGAVATYLNEAERLAKIAQTQSGGKDWASGLLLQQIKEIRAREGQAMTDFLGMFLGNAAATARPSLNQSEEPNQNSSGITRKDAEANQQEYLRREEERVEEERRWRCANEQSDPNQEYNWFKSPDCL